MAEQMGEVFDLDADWLRIAGPVSLKISSIVQRFVSWLRAKNRQPREGSFDLLTGPFHSGGDGKYPRRIIDELRKIAGGSDRRNLHPFWWFVSHRVADMLNEDLINAIIGDHRLYGQEFAFSLCTLDFENMAKSVPSLWAMIPDMLASGDPVKMYFASAFFSGKWLMD